MNRVEKRTNLLSGLPHEHVTLSVRDDLGSVKSLLEIVAGGEKSRRNKTQVSSSSPAAPLLDILFYEKGLTHMNCCLSPVKGTFSGPGRTLEARVRSSLMAERHRAKTASPMRVTGVPRSRALIAVHFPVPFCPALL